MHPADPDPGRAPGRPTVAVVGAGISGLATAHFLRAAGARVVVLEQDAAPGGTMKTERHSGWLIEHGPNSTLETTPLLGRLFEEAGLGAQRVYANPASSRRYIVRKGKLHPLPSGPISFFTSGLWSTRGKLRLLMEPLAGRAAREETVAEFVQRRLGREFLDYAINPFVAGVYAGNPGQLSVRSAFPKLYALEEEYGGLFMGLVRGRKERAKRAGQGKERARLFSFLGGMQALPGAIASSLGEALMLSARVERIVPLRAGKFPLYTVSYEREGRKAALEAAAVVLSVPAFRASAVIRPIDPETASQLDSIYYPPVVEVFTGFRASQIARPLDGFGFLVPEAESRNILGTIWSSALFPGRAPASCAACTSFVGGSRQPELTSGGDDEIAALVLRDLRPLMQITGDPLVTRIVRWERAIPQYNLGHAAVMRTLDRFEQNFPGAFLCGNYRGGISVGDCVVSAERTSRAVAEHLKRLA